MSEPADENVTGAVPPPADDDHHRPPDDKEVIYFDGRPQLRGEVGRVSIFSLVGLLLIAIPFVWAGISKGHAFPIWWLTLGLICLGILSILSPLLLAKTIHYRITNYRIDFERGVVSKNIDTMELWHVEDIQFHQGLFDRIFNVGCITVFSNDKTTPKLELRGVPRPRDIFDNLKRRIIAVKRQSGVMKMDMG